MPYKAAFFDLDGTLISFESDTVPPSTVQALQALRDRGYKLFVATGRARMTTRFIEGTFVFDGYITLNGQHCYDQGGDILKLSLDKQDVARWVNLVEDKGFSCLFSEADHEYLNHIDAFTLADSALTNVPPPPIDDIRRALNTDIYAMVVYVPEAENAWLDTEVEGYKNLRVARSVPTCADINLGGCSKVTGIEAMLRHHGLEAVECIAFGDGYNDIDMLRFVGLGIAMGGAPEAVQASADYVADRPDEDGIYNALKYFELI